MIILDVNVLVAACLDVHPHHKAARRYLREALEAGDVAVPDVVWSGLVRVVTGERPGPQVSWPELRAFIDAVRRHPGYHADIRGMAAPVESFVAMCQATGASGNLISDAYIAAVAIDHNAAVATFDTDFARLPVPVVRPPLAS